MRVQVLTQWAALLTTILSALEEAVQAICIESNPEGDRKGGYFCLMDVRTGRMIIPPTLAGTIPDGRNKQYRFNCEEKARRVLVLIQAAENYPNHSQEEAHRDILGCSSFRLRDETRGQWGGAIVVCDEARNYYILSFSGLTEEGDEAVCCWVANAGLHISSDQYEPNIKEETKGYLNRTYLV